VGGRCAQQSERRDDECEARGPGSSWMAPSGGQMGAPERRLGRGSRDPRGSGRSESRARRADGARGTTLTTRSAHLARLGGSSAASSPSVGCHAERVAASELVGSRMILGWGDSLRSAAQARHTTGAPETARKTRHERFGVAQLTSGRSIRSRTWSRTWNARYRATNRCLVRSRSPRTR
jgi:hypothetical protein